MQRDEVEAGRDLHKDRCAAARTALSGLLRLVASCVDSRSPRALSTVAAALLLPAFATGAAIALRDAQFQTLGCGSVAARSSGDRPTEGDDPLRLHQGRRAGGRAQSGPVDAGTAVTIRFCLDRLAPMAWKRSLRRWQNAWASRLTRWLPISSGKYRPTPLLQRFARV